MRTHGPETARDDSETHQYWTLPWVPGQRFIDKPVYVLTSLGTFSGGEEFTFDLKTQKRATIVGEVTGWGTVGTVLNVHLTSKWI